MADLLVKSLYDAPARSGWHIRKNLLERTGYDNQELLFYDYGRLSCSSGGELPLSKSPEDSRWVIYWIRSGSGKLFCNQESFSLRKNDVFIIEPSDDIQVRIPTGSKMEISMLHLLDSPACRMLFSRLQQEALLHLKEPEQLEPFFRAIEDLCAAGLKLAEKTILRDLSVQVYGVIAEISRQCLDFESRLTIEQVRQELSCRAKNNRTLAELAEKCGLSERSFERQFRKHCGCSFLQYLQGAKIGGACILLQNTLYSIDEIVRICNFRSKPYFYRTFKKQTGTTPMAFRDSHRKGKRTQLSSLISKNKTEKISSPRKKILWLIIQNPCITVSQIARNLSFSRSAVQKNIEWLKNNGFIIRRGSRRNGYWYFQADQAASWNPDNEQRK